MIKASNSISQSTFNQRPLADKIRPDDLNLMVGQDHLFNENGIITRILQSNKIPSCILWGPAGCGKTTTAKILAKHSNLEVEFLSATNSGSADLRAIFDKAERQDLISNKQGIVLLVDEIHCFKRNQQDLFLPFVENGLITLIGTTTENPSFEINSALLSRCRLIIFNVLDNEALKKLIKRANEVKRIPIDESDYDLLCDLSGADGRYLLNLCEELQNMNTSKTLNKDEISKVLQHKGAVYDKARDGHYNLISALHKSVRGSDVQAALYWCARMMVAGENPHFLLRRLIRMAMEDIGMADPQALVQATSTLSAYDLLGSPEGDLAITNLVIYLANAPKSNSGDIARIEVMQAVKGHTYQPPKVILNAPTKLMENLDYGKDYQYDHDTPNCFSGQNYFPKEYGRREFYKPNERGFEREIKKRIEYWEKLRKELNK
ncbi:MAG: replication-associated recombination protein A [Rickettsiales bacterium]|jgi:putative ATPase|nr:replication-associated recombination protein A [Rickettsiales bacterium]